MTQQPEPSMHPLDAALRGVTAVSRRGFLAFGGLLAVGCATQPTRTSKLPDPIWRDPGKAPTPAVCPPVIKRNTEFKFVMDRELWCRGECVPALMNPMLPPKYITVHHDGMSPFLSTDQSSSSARVEMIRNGHRSKGWGDIGYHYVVDRGGRVWEGREIKWQGAHVKNENEGNIGICCMGNFDEQSPSDAQLQACQRMVECLMAKYRIPVSRVKTHQEWASAHTACPGRSLQREMVVMRQKTLAYLPIPGNDDFIGA
ncbi:MAG: N-acetylmuramoyl-L-alanine amidase [Betaproteobacteria bacterium]|nr:N-acetylmuramoyl-L-alanine amidase [Betaproteobacteria bacterium]